MVDKMMRTAGYPWAGEPEHPVARNCRNSVYACDGVACAETAGFEGGALGESPSSSSESSSSFSDSASRVQAFGWSVRCHASVKMELAVIGQDVPFKYTSKGCHIADRTSGSGSTQAERRTALLSTGSKASIRPIPMRQQGTHVVSPSLPLY